ncbi:sugar ABC transporter permease [Paenibacillus chibensis]|uniref:Sugar ABC transporter permease n=1 Tax=Paenibacillus chibensis TaxID=59846 RepID=A0ABU6PY80_9BACL|nr:sugar ABC transporter permease [Paenibacillus chibensis]
MKTRGLYGMKRWIPYLFLAPTLISLLTFNYYPALSALYYSFTDWNGFNAPNFIGLDNFVEMAKSLDFQTGFRNMLIITVFSVFVSVTIPAIAAEFIYKTEKPRMQHFFRLMFVFPLVIPGMVILLLWQFLLNPEVGLINSLLTSLGVSEEHLPLWLGSPDTALASFMLIGFPWVNGVGVLIYLAGFQNIPKSVIEAAKMDGATGFSLIWKIEVPLIASQIKLIAILNIIGGIQAFQNQLVLTGGGPGYSTTVPGFIMYQSAMSASRFGYASAIGLVLFVLIFIFTLINNKYIKSDTEYNPD